MTGGGEPGTEDVFRAVFHGSIDGIIILDEDGRILEWNEGEERITGISSSEAVGRMMWDVQVRLVPEEIRPGFIEAAREKVLRGIAEGTALRRVLLDEIQLPDGRRRFIESVVFPIRSGGRTLACGICRDVTERMRLEEDLREREGMLAEAERVAHLGHWERDLRTGESFWSSEVYRILGFEPGAWKPGHAAFLEAVHPEDRERIRRELQRTVEDGVARRAEYRVMTPRGEVRHAIGTVELLLDRRGEPARIFGTVQDITERKVLERELEAANRHKDAFLSMLSHELRNILSPLRGGLSLLALTEPQGEEGARVREMLERQITHLSRLVEDLLDLARIASGKILLRIERIDLGVLFSLTLEDHRKAFEDKGIRLEVLAGSGPLWATVDPTRIAQVLGNLLSNALKFTPGGGRVEVAWEREGAEAALRVRDTGAGIDPEALDRLFEPFMQADRTVTRARGGLGLGLALVKDLAELHGGSVRAASEGPGRGAEFTLRIPLEETPGDRVKD